MMQWFPDYVLCIYTYVHQSICLYLFLVISTIMFSIVTIFIYAVLLVDQFCKFWVSSVIMWALLLASSYNLTAMAIERHGAITRPLRHDEHKVRRRFPLILILVYIPVILHVLPIYITTEHVNGVCIVNSRISESLKSALIYIYMFMDLIIPGSVMLFCYVHMAWFLKHAVGLFGSAVKESDSNGELNLSG